MLLKYQGNNYLKVVKATIQATKIKNPCKSMTYKGFCGEVGTVLKTLAPEGQNIIIKTNEGTRYYKLDWRDDYGTHGMPFNP